MNRRSTLAGIGLILSLPLGGCLSERLVRDDTANDDETNAEPDPEDEEDPLSIDGRLHNESERAREFEIGHRPEGAEETVRNTAAVAPGETVHAPAFGKPGETWHYEVVVGDETAETELTFDVEREPDCLDGLVHVTFTERETVEIEFESRAESEEIDC